MIPKNFSTYILGILSEHNFVVLNENIMKKNNDTNNDEISMYNYLKYNNKLFIHINKLFYINNINKKEKYKIFMFVRNPYKRFISGFLYSNKSNNKYKYVNDILKNINHLDIVTFFHTIVPQSFFINYNTNLLKNIHIYSDEDIEKNKNNMLSEIGIETHEYINKEYYKNESIYEKPFYEYYDDYTLKKINELFSDDFEMFNYKKIHDICIFKKYFQNN
jgi:hypothetical protein